MAMFNKKDIGPQSKKELHKDTGHISPVEQTIVRKMSPFNTQMAFVSKIRKLVNLILASPNLDTLLVNLKDEVLGLVDAERITIYAVTEDGKEIFSKVKAGDEIREFRVPIDNTSIAGYVARNLKVLMIQDVYSSDELSAIDAELRFNREFDLQTGFRTKQMLVVPVVSSGKLMGVLQLINKKNGESFLPEDRQAATEIAETLSVAFHNQEKTRVKQLSKFDLLVAENLVLSKEIEEAVQTARDSNQPVEKILIEKFKIKKADIGRALQSFYRTVFYEFKPGIPIPDRFIGALDPNYLRQHLWVPLRQEEESVFIVIDNPRALDKIDDIKKQIHARSYRVMVALPDDILKTIDYFWGAEKKAEVVTPQDDVSRILNDIVPEATTEEKEAEEVSETDNAVIRLVNRIITDAYEQNVSDIHIEPYHGKEETIVRFRVDGVCKEYQRLPNNVKRAVISRIKIMSDLDISNRRLPQDGKIQFKKYGGADIELRVATLPTVGDNEDAVMRILAAHKPLPLDQIGMSAPNFDKFTKLVHKPYGIALVVGPTGSGKTTTLHSALGFINTPEKKIWTAEDPVEITQYGLRQVQVLPKAGYTFAIAMRAFLRANPDVIMIGEMRDLETASIAIEASLTGHLVFSTLHTNSAAETVVRLLEMGIDPFNFADALLGVLAQRLLRTLCKCKESYHPTPEQYQELVEDYDNEQSWQKNGRAYKPDMTLYRAKGCDKCRMGYKGRMGIHELLEGTEHIKSLIHKRATAEQLREVAMENGMTTLKQDGILKVLQGHTDLFQVRAVCIK